MKDKIYDINYTLEETMLFTIIAPNKKRAFEIAQKQLDNMSKNELVERFLASVVFGLKITNCEDTGETYGK